MVKEIVHDPIFLAVKSTPATKEDIQVAYDLMDTLDYHHKTCVGMAANMIGVSKRIIAFVDQSDAKVLSALCLIPKSFQSPRPTIRKKVVCPCLARQKNANATRLFA